MKHAVRMVAHWGLLFHIYVSMAGFTLALLFAATGLSLNHQDFGLSEPRVVKSTLRVDGSLLSHTDQPTIEKYLRGKLGIRSPVTDYHDDADQIQVTFAAPGKRTTVTVNRADGTGDVETESRGLLGKLDDLHKGSDTGRIWSWAIDVSATLLIVSSLTGMVTLIAIRHRRRKGFMVGALGVLMIVLIYLIWVPR